MRSLLCDYKYRNGIREARGVSFTVCLIYSLSTTTEVLTQFYLMFCRQKKVFLLLLGNLKPSPKIRSGSIKSTRIKIERKIKNIRSTSTGTRIEVKTRTRTKRKIRVDVKILVLNTRGNTMKRLGFEIFIQLLCLWVMLEV